MSASRPTLQDVPPALEFRPTAEEFQDPLRYIRSIRSLACKTGICKIIPPSSWRPPRVLSDTHTVLRARTQALHMLRDRGGGGRDLLESIRRAAEEVEGEGKVVWPPAILTPKGFVREIDVGKMWRIISGKGGVRAIERSKSWGWIGKQLGLDMECAEGKEIEKDIRKVYRNYVDRWRRKVEGLSYSDNFEVSDSEEKEDDDDEDDHDHDHWEDTPYCELRDSASFSSESESYWDCNDAASLNRSALEGWRADRKRRMQNLRQARQRDRSGRTKRTSNGSDSDWIPEEEGVVSDCCIWLRGSKRKTRQNRRYLLRQADSDMEMDGGQPAMSIDIHSVPQKRRSNRNAGRRRVRPPSRRILVDSSSNEDSSCAESDRCTSSNDAHSSDHSFSSSHSSSAEKYSPSGVSSSRNQRAHRPWHKDLSAVATLQICKHCGEILVSKNDKSVCISRKCCKEFVDGDFYCLRDFRAMAAEFRRDWFRSRRFEVRPNLSPSCFEVEGEYWNIIESAKEAVWVQYGADLDTRIVGSGFPQPHCAIKDLSDEDKELYNLYSSHPWNLNNISNMRGSLLGCLPTTVAGVNSPWLYIGMLFSTFCYHVEDSNMYSLNYMHFTDEPKTAECQGKVWYGCPGGRNARHFENAVKGELRELFGAQPDILFDITTMVSPVHLMGKCEVYRLVQRPGEFVVTFPQAYHCGFSLGFNVAEAVNFLTADALPFCRAASRRYRLFKRKSAIAPEEILFLNSQPPYVDTLNLEDAVLLFRELAWLIKRERRNRQKLREIARFMGILLTEKVLDPSSENCESCAKCKQPCTWTVATKVSDREPLGESLCLICSTAMIYATTPRMGKVRGISDLEVKARYEILLCAVPYEELEAACRRLFEQCMHLRDALNPRAEYHSPTDIRCV